MIFILRLVPKAIGMRFSFRFSFVATARFVCRPCKGITKVNILLRPKKRFLRLCHGEKREGLLKRLHSGIKKRRQVLKTCLH